MEKRILISASIILLLLSNEITALAFWAVVGTAGVNKLLKVMYEGGFY